MQFDSQPRLNTNTPSSSTYPAPGLDSRSTERIHDFALYCIARQIADRLCAIALKHGCELIDYRHRDADAVCWPTSDGLFLDYTFGDLLLWTPWGTWGFLSLTDYVPDRVREEVEELLGARLHRAEECESIGLLQGPIFAITRFAGKALPKAVEMDESNCRSVQEITAAWKTLTARYRS